jgi:hypothetical protein
VYSTLTARVEPKLVLVRPSFPDERTMRLDAPDAPAPLFLSREPVPLDRRTVCVKVRRLLLFFLFWLRLACLSRCCCCCVSLLHTYSNVCALCL